MSPGEWQYHNPTRVIYGMGILDKIAQYTEFQHHVLITSPGFTSRGVVDRISRFLGNRLVKLLDDVKPNPDLSDIDRQACLLGDLRPDAVIALGGGSSMDTAKALARLLTQPAGVSLATYFHGGVRFSQGVPALPVIAIPTTSGTGAEVTPFGTVWDFERGKKYSVTGDDLYPAMAILDPELTLSLPAEITVSSGLDAISHALESAWNKNATPITLSLAAKSLQLSLSALPALKARPDDSEARCAMMQASLLAGIAISQTRTALAHSISYPLTTKFNLPHGIACGFCLPVLMLFNAQVDDGRLLHLARAAGFSGIEEFASYLKKIFHQLGVAELFKHYVQDPEAIIKMTDMMFSPDRAGNNIRIPSRDDMVWLIRDAATLISRGYIEK